MFHEVFLRGTGSLFRAVNHRAGNYSKKRSRVTRVVINLGQIFAKEHTRGMRVHQNFQSLSVAKNSTYDRAYDITGVSDFCENTSGQSDFKTSHRKLFSEFFVVGEMFHQTTFNVSKLNYQLKFDGRQFCLGGDFKVTFCFWNHVFFSSNERIHKRIYVYIIKLFILLYLYHYVKLFILFYI